MRARRGVLGVGALGLAAWAALTVQRGGALEAQQVRPPDSLYAVQALAAVRGATPLACDMLMRAVGTGWWGNLEREPDMHRGLMDHERWMARASSDPAAVAPLARGLGDADPCVRRVAARLLGRNRHPSAVRALLAALDGTPATTRVAAALGLGYAEQRGAVPTLLRTLDDAEPTVRAAAAWALGAIDDPGASARLIRLLQQDRDPAVRQAAAWALGDLSS